MHLRRDELSSTLRRVVFLRELQFRNCNAARIKGSLMNNDDFPEGEQMNSRIARCIAIPRNKFPVQIPGKNICFEKFGCFKSVFSVCIELANVACRTLHFVLDQSPAQNDMISQRYRARAQQYRNAF